MSKPKQEQWHAPGNGNVVTADGELVVSVPRPKGTGATAKRDARVKLIAAAPDLLEAAKLCASLFPDIVRGSTLESAIAKAEGKEPPHAD